MNDRNEETLRLLDRLAQAAGGDGKPIWADISCREYDWHVPQHFDAGQMQRLAELGEALAAGLSRALSEALQSEVKFTAGPPAQRFGARLLEELGAAARYRLTLAGPDGPCGLLLLEPEEAFAWVNAMLGGGGGSKPPAEGDEEQDAAGRELSELEMDLLADTMGVAAGAVAAVFKEHAGGPLEASGPVGLGAVRLPGDADGEWCVLAFGSGEEGAEPGVRLILPCALLDPVVGAADEPGRAGGDDADNRARMEGHFAAVMLPAEAVVGEVELTFRDVMDLEVGDVVVLPQSASDPIELRVGGRGLFAGRAVEAAGRYGVEILSVAASPAGEAETN